MGLLPAEGRTTSHLPILRRRSLSPTDSFQKPSNKIGEIMSFSLRVTVDHADGYKSEITIVDGQTYNLVPMWKRAGLIPEGESTEWLNGKTCAEMKTKAVWALLDYVVNTHEYEALDPINGWGDHEGFFNHGLRVFVAVVHQHPTGVIHWEG